MKSKIVQNKNRTILIPISLFLGLLFLILSYFVNKDVFRGIDYDLMVQSQNTFPRFVDLPFSILTLIGSSEVVLLGVLSIFSYYLLKKKRIFLSIFLFGAIFIIEIFGKLFIYHPIPPPLLNRNVLPFHLPSSFLVHTNYSYPSGHMSRITFMLGILIFLFTIETSKKSPKILFYFGVGVLIALMAISRVYLGEHWASDVVGGILLGGSIAGLSTAFW